VDNGRPNQQQQQQEQHLQQQQHPDDSTMGMMNEAVDNGRPKEHYMTITKDGTIVEASNTVIGFPPEALLMTSTYDTLFDEDLPGFLCVKSQFWDKQQLDVEVFIRRRSIEGDWIWLVSKAVSWLAHPIHGVMLAERVVDDEYMAQKFNRITRITAIVVQAAEASRLSGDTSNMNTGEEEPSQHYEEESSSLMKETAEIESLLRRLQDNGALAISDHNDMHQLLEIASTQGKGHNNNNNADGDNNNNENNPDGPDAPGRRKKGFDPFQMIENVRQGVRLDLGLTKLELEEVKLLAMVLTGELDVEAVAPLVLESLQTGHGLAKVFEWAAVLKANKAEEIARAQLAEKNNFNMMAQQQWNNGANQPAQMQSMSRISEELNPPPPPIAVVNLSYAYIGNMGMELFAEALFVDGSALKTLDVSFCGIDEKGFLAMARGLSRRKKKGIDALRGLILSGNHISQRAASELGAALAISTAVSDTKRGRRNKRRSRVPSGGYDTDSSDDEEDEDDDFNSAPTRRRTSEKKQSAPCCHKNSGLQVLHLASTSLKPESLGRLIEGMGPHSSLREINLSSNNFQTAGASVLARCLDGSADKSRGGHVPLPFLDRLDMSDNALGDNGATQLTKIISARSKAHFVDLRLSCNSVSAVGIEKIMNKLLSHNLVSLALDKNAIGDQGCQLVAASLQSMKSLGHLNLSFNQIGSRGINSLMRSLIACESVTYLGLSGNILKISGAMALAFTLAQHPRIEELHLDNCCLGQAAQCHIVAGIISNRWVPMKKLTGYAVGPPMVAIGALKPYAQNFVNEECFRIRKDEQMKTILQWMETNRGSTTNMMDPNVLSALGSDSSDQRFLTPEFVSNINDVHGIPSQNAYFRLLGWLSSIPFDDDELQVLQKYFYDVDGGDGDRGSDGYINLKLRGDLLAALDSDVAEEIRDVFPSLAEEIRGSVGLGLDKFFRSPHSNGWNVMRGEWYEDEFSGIYAGNEQDAAQMEAEEKAQEEESAKTEKLGQYGFSGDDTSSGQAPKKPLKVKSRITMFPKFEQQLEQLKSAAAEMIEQEEDPMHHEVILTQYAEASLTILRQLRYHCMNSGLDGWRQGGLKRKVLVVDDSRIIRKMVSRAFENANFIVDTASNGAEGVEKMKASIYDIAFMDIDMPVMNGFEATKKLRDWEDTTRPGARQPICALTAAYVDDFERSELMKFKEAGLDVMESKPCNIPRLFKVVDDVSPMFSDLSLNVTQRERSEGKLSSMLSNVN